MSKPVDKTAFWKKRIETATKEQYSVYVVEDEHWQYINNIHKTLCGRYIKPGQTVLDAGCGYGRLSEWFDNYIGVDFSPDFIELATEKYPAKKFQQANLKKLPFEDGEFDWAVCASIRGMILENLGEETWKEMEVELKRVAKKVLILEYSDPTTHEIL